MKGEKHALVSQFVQLVFLLTGTLLSGGCSQEYNPSEDASIPVNFSTGIHATRVTADGKHWQTYDRVGIFMLTTGGNLTTSANLANNREYSTTPGGYVSTASFYAINTTNAIYYPYAGNVDFIAYYPFSNTMSSGYNYTISVDNQISEDHQKAIDVLYAKTTNVARSLTPVNLQYRHVMSKITFNVSAGDGVDYRDIQNLIASQVQFTKMPLSTTLALQNGTLTAGTNTTQPFSPLKTLAEPGCHATFTAIIVPQPTGHGLNGRTAVFNVNGNSYTWSIPDSEIFESGNHYIYPVTVLKSSITVGAPTINTWNESNKTSAAVSPVEFVHITCGPFQMGSPSTEPGRTTVETQRLVMLTNNFYMGKYEVTNAQYSAFLNAAGVGSTGSHPAIQAGQMVIRPQTSYGLIWQSFRWVPVTGYENHPVINVSWYGAKAFADFYGYSLPTEAQWEYACRGGQSESFPFGIGNGTKLIEGMANFDTRYLYQLPGGPFDILSATPVSKTSPVGNYNLSNGYGLYDMHGNAQEWCADWYGTYSGDTNPTGPNSGISRVVRGGNWGDRAQNCRSATRNAMVPDNSTELTGFRVVVMQ